MGDAEPVATAQSRSDARIALVVVAAFITLELQTFGLGAVGVNVAVFMTVAMAVVFLRFATVARSFGLIFTRPIIFIVAYAGWCMISLAWTATPRATMIHSSVLAVMLLLALACSDIPMNTVARQFVRSVAALALVSWAMALVVPQIAVLPDIVWRLNGPMRNSQRLALLMAVGLLILAVLRLRGERAFKTPRVDAAVALLLLVTMLATQTRAFSIFFFAALAAVIFFRMQPWQKVLTLYAGVGSIAFLVLNFATVMGALNRDGADTTTLTGRTKIWDLSIMMIEQKPWFGYGFASFYSDLTAFFFPTHIASHAHNTWINATFETGLIGCGLLSLFMFGTLITSRGGRARFSFALMTYAMLAGLTGQVFGGKLTPVSAFVILVVFVERGRAFDRGPSDASPDARSRRSPRYSRDAAYLTAPRAARR